MQKPNLNPPIRAVCTTSDGAASDKPVFVIKTYYNSTIKSWYRKYSDGTIVQGGYGTDHLKDSTWTVNFVTPFTTTNIDIHITPVFNATPTQIQGGMAIASITTDDFVIHGDTYIAATEGYYWEATGI